MVEAPRRTSRPLRTAQLIETLEMGGAENLAVQIANSLATAGHVSHLYVMTGPGPLSARIEPQVQVEYLRCALAPFGRPWRLFRSIVKGYRRLSQRVQADGVELVQTHLPRANFWGLLLAMRRRCQVVATVHNNQEFLYGDADNPLRARLRREAYRRILLRCSATVAVSDEVRLSLINQLGIAAGHAQRLVTITNGVDIPPIATATERQAIRSRYGIPIEVPLVLAAGRLTAQKNFAILVGCAARLRDQGIPCRFLIAGEGPLGPDLESLIAAQDLTEMVVLPGNVPDLGVLMHGAEVFALPSLWEGMPLVLLEAMAHSLPVVGSRIKGVAEVVEAGTSGLLVDPGDTAAFTEALASLLQSPARRQRYGAAGRAVVQKMYSFDRVAAEVEALYLRLLSPGT